MDLFFQKNKNKFTVKNVFFSTNIKPIANVNPRLSLISYNQAKLTYVFSSINFNIHIYNGTLLVFYNNYLRSLRKTFIPWILSVNLSETIKNKQYDLLMSFYNLRHRRIYNKYSKKVNVYLNFSWTSRFYKAARIKRWLRKKYTNSLWR